MRAIDPSVDAYLEDVASPEARAALEHLRRVIREAAPDAEECIAYGIPSYKQGGYLVGFAAFKNHCSFFPGAVVAEFAPLLAGYKLAKGTVQFQPGNPLADDLVRHIVAVRLAQNLARKQR